MRKSFKRVYLLVSVFMVVMLAACSDGDTNATGEDNPDSTGGPISAKIGVISYMTGPGAAYGEAITNGFNLALDEINEKGEVKIELVIEDSAGKQDQALTVAQKLMSSDDIVALIGPTLSTEMNVVGPEADINGIPIMGTSTTAAGIPQIGEYVFRNSIPESLAIPAALEKAVNKYGAKKVAILYGNDDLFTQSGFDTMKAEAERYGPRHFNN